MASNLQSNPSVRVIIQQCLSAKLQVQSASEEQEAQYVEIKRGVILYVCFLKGATRRIIPKVAKSVLNVKLSESEQNGPKVSVLDLGGDILILPQATLGGKAKGKKMQYHSCHPKDEAMMLYDKFTTACKDLVAQTIIKNPGRDSIPEVKCGSYDFLLEVLSIQTDGPYTHILDF